MYPVPDDRRPALQPPRYALRTLLWLIALASVLLAVVTSFSNAYAIFAFVLAVLAIMAHILGAAIGHRLRDNGDRPIPPPQDKDAAYRAVEQHEFAPRTTLSQHRSPGPLILILTLVGTALGAAAGAALLIFLNGERATVANTSYGAAAFAVLGAIWGFASASFLLELLGACSQANRGE